MLIPQNLRRQEFIITPPTFAVRLATTVNGTLATAFDNGSVIDGETIATNDLILLKNQNTASENGVYIAQASGAPVRHSSYDTYLELNTASVSVTEGDENGGTNWYQRATLISLSTDQEWLRKAKPQTFIVPDNVKQMFTESVGGGGGGGGGGGLGSGSTGGGQGGAGGAGSGPMLTPFQVIPGGTLTIDLGEGGLPGEGGSGVTGGDGGTGGDTTITGSGVALTFKGAPGGDGGVVVTSLPGSAVTPGIPNEYRPSCGIVKSGDGGLAASGSEPLGAGAAGEDSAFASGGTGGVEGSGANGNGGGGGGGGASFGAGGNGGDGPVGGVDGSPGTDGGYGAGGGGGSGAGDAAGTTVGGRGGRGGDGKCVLYWYE